MLQPRVKLHRIQPAFQTTNRPVPDRHSNHRPTGMEIAPLARVLLISTERYLAVCAPLTAYRIGRRRLRYAVVVIVVASIAFNAPRFFEFQPIAEPLTQPSGPQSAADGHLAYATNQSVTPSVPLSTVTKIVLGNTWLRYDEVYQYVYNTAITRDAPWSCGNVRRCGGSVTAVYHVVYDDRVSPHVFQYCPMLVSQPDVIFNS